MAVSCSNKDNTGPNTPEVPENTTPEVPYFSSAVTKENIDAFLKQLQTPSATATKIDVETKENTKFVHIPLANAAVTKTSGKKNEFKAAAIAIKDKKGAGGSTGVSASTAGVTIAKIKDAVVAALDESGTGIGGAKGQATKLALNGANTAAAVTVAITDGSTAKNAEIRIAVKEKSNTDATGTIIIPLTIDADITGTAESFVFAQN